MTRDKKEIMKTYKFDSKSVLPLFDLVLEMIQAIEKELKTLYNMVSILRQGHSIHNTIQNFLNRKHSLLR